MNLLCIEVLSSLPLKAGDKQMDMGQQSCMESYEQCSDSIKAVACVLKPQILGLQTSNKQLCLHACDSMVSAHGSRALLCLPPSMEPPDAVLLDKLPYSTLHMVCYNCGSVAEPLTLSLKLRPEI